MKTAKTALLAAICALTLILVGCTAPESYPADSTTDVAVMQTTAELTWDTAFSDTTTELTQDTVSSDTTTGLTSEADTATSPVTDTDTLTDTDTAHVTETEPVTTAAPHIPPQTSTAARVTETKESNKVSDTADDTEPEDSEITVHTTEKKSDEPVPRPVPDYAAMAKRDFDGIILDAAAYVYATPIGSSFEAFSYEKHNARASLSDTAKALYDDMLSHALTFEPVTYSPGDGYAAVDIIAAAEALVLDELEVRCYFGVKETENGGYEVCYRLPSDGTDVTYADKTALYDEIQYLRAAGRLIVDSMPSGITVYDRYRYLASVISLITEYDMDYIHNYNNDTPYGALIGGLTICRGYAYGFEYLCSLADLYCGRVEGMSFANNVHMWNVIKLEGGTYHVDVTWSDSGSNKPCDSRWMHYFAKTQEEILNDHIISDGTETTGK